jgi:hypothetical protein
MDGFYEIPNQARCVLCKKELFCETCNSNLACITCKFQDNRFLNS